MSRNREFAPGEFYHLYNRGTEKRNIFTSHADYERFRALLYLVNGTARAHLQLQGRTLKEIGEISRGDNLVNIGAYCLMPNHFHLVVQESVDRGVSLFMQKLLTGYTMYFNKRHDRGGALFQGRFKVQHATNDRYLKYVISYVHLNPVVLFDPKWKEGRISHKRQAQAYLGQYPYSSYIDYAGNKRAETKLLDIQSFPAYFKTVRNFRDEIEEWLDYSENFKVRP